jgi:ubiquitin C-terminal hydrolase
MSQEERKVLSGLTNIGNTCYFNSGIQSLTSITLLSSYLLNEKVYKHLLETFKDKENKSKGTALVILLSNTMELILKREL